MVSSIVEDEYFVYDVIRVLVTQVSGQQLNGAKQHNKVEQHLNS